MKPASYGARRVTQECPAWLVWLMLLWGLPQAAR